MCMLAHVCVKGRGQKQAGGMPGAQATLYHPLISQLSSAFPVTHTGFLDK